jgi:hypothetical protein
MSPRTHARLVAAAHVALGAPFLLAPRFAGSFWLGSRHARSAPAGVLLRAIGARDVGVGLAGLWAAEHDDPAVTRAALGLHLVADAADVVITSAARRRLASGPATFATLASVVAAAGSASGIARLAGGS